MHILRGIKYERFTIKRWVNQYIKRVENSITLKEIKTDFIAQRFEEGVGHAAGTRPFIVIDRLIFKIEIV
jgi:hypothetical protein